MSFEDVDLISYYDDFVNFVGSERNRKFVAVATIDYSAYLDIREIYVYWSEAYNIYTPLDICFEEVVDDIEYYLSFIDDPQLVDLSFRWFG